MGEFSSHLAAAAARATVVVARPGQRTMTARLVYWPMPTPHPDRRKRHKFARVLLPTGKYLSIRPEHVLLGVPEEAPDGNVR